MQGRETPALALRCLPVQAPTRLSLAELGPTGMPPLERPRHETGHHDAGHYEQNPD